MNKKFAAVGLAFTLILGLTNCTGSTPAGATQLNTSIVNNQTKAFFGLEKNKSPNGILQKNYLKAIKINKNTIKMKNVLEYLKSRERKTPYVFSGSSPLWGWDCSGLVLWTYKKFGIELKHSATAQAHTGKRVSYKNAKPGDIVTFSWGSSYWYYHAAIYLGHGKIINANSGYRTTIIQPLTDFKGNKIRFIRIVETNY
jgi:cell wall-associated NlpC family hydrolase